MNSSWSPHGQETPSECELFFFLGGRLDSSTTEAYAVLVFIAIMTIITCPITTVLNALVMFVVGTKPRLKTMSNFALGCLATTDGMMGAIGHPLFIAEIAAILQGEVSYVSCSIIQLAKYILRVLGAASLFHLTLMNLERYIAIKQSFAYVTIVTKCRILCSSALAWIVSLLLTVPLAIINNSIYLAVSNITTSLCIAIILYCQVVLYFEIRRHEKQIAAQQVSLEAKKKFLKEKRAFKLTTTVVFILLLTYLPLMVVRILIVNSVLDSVNVTYIAFFTTSFVVILNSLINPIIYCIRIREFRVAVVETVLKKNNAQAEEIEMQVFGTLNACEQHEEGQQREEGQNNEQGNFENTGIINNNNNNSDSNINDSSNDSDNNNDENNSNSNNSEDNNNHNNNKNDNDDDDDDNNNNNNNSDSNNSDSNMDDSNNNDDRGNNNSKDSSNNSDGNSNANDDNNNDDEVNNNNNSHNDNGNNDNDN